MESVFDNNKFITIIQNIPSLWDKSDPDYANKGKKENTWKKVMVAMYGEETNKWKIDKQNQIEDDKLVNTSQEERESLQSIDNIENVEESPSSSSTTEFTKDLENLNIAYEIILLDVKIKVIKLAELYPNGNLKLLSIKADYEKVKSNCEHGYEYYREVMSTINIK